MVFLDDDEDDDEVASRDAGGPEDPRRLRSGFTINALACPVALHALPDKIVATAYGRFLTHRGLFRPLLYLNVLLSLLLQSSTMVRNPLLGEEVASTTLSCRRDPHYFEVRYPVVHIWHAMLVLLAHWHLVFLLLHRHNIALARMILMSFESVYILFNGVLGVGTYFAMILSTYGDQLQTIDIVSIVILMLGVKPLVVIVATLDASRMGRWNKLVFYSLLSIITVSILASMSQQNRAVTSMLPMNGVCGRFACSTLRGILRTSMINVAAFQLKALPALLYDRPFTHLKPHYVWGAGGLNPTPAQTGGIMVMEVERHQSYMSASSAFVRQYIVPYGSGDSLRICPSRCSGRGQQCRDEGPGSAGPDGVDERRVSASASSVATSVTAEDATRKAAALGMPSGMLHAAVSTPTGGGSPDEEAMAGMTHGPAPDSRYGTPSDCAGSLVLRDVSHGNGIDVLDTSGHAEASGCEGGSMVAEASEATRVHDPPEALAGGDVRPPWSSCCTASNGECPMEEHWENQESTALATTCFERSVATRVRDFPDPLAGADVRPPWGSCCTATSGECLMEEHGEHQASTTLATTCLERPVAAGDAQYTGDQDRAPGSMGLLAAEDRGFAERVRDNEKKLELALACLARIEERMLREARELAPARDPHAASPRARPRSRFRLRIMQQVEMDAESPGAAPRPAAPQVPAGLTPRPLGERDGSDSPCTSSPAVSCILPASSLQRAPDFYYLEGDTIPDAKAHVGKEDTDALLDPGSRACSS